MTPKWPQDYIRWFWDWQYWQSWVIWATYYKQLREQSDYLGMYFGTMSKQTKVNDIQDECHRCLFVRNQDPVGDILNQTSSSNCRLNFPSNSDCTDVQVCSLIVSPWRWQVRRRVRVLSSLDTRWWRVKVGPGNKSSWSGWHFFLFSVQCSFILPAFRNNSNRLHVIDVMCYMCNDFSVLSFSVIIIDFLFIISSE